MDNFLNMYTLSNIDWIWVFKKLCLFLYFYCYIYYNKLMFSQQLNSFENDYGVRTKNNFLFFIQSFIYVCLSILMVPFIVIFVNLFEEPDFALVNLMVVSIIISVLYCLKRLFFYIYITDTTSTLKDIISIQENKFKRKPKA